LLLYDKKALEKGREKAQHKRQAVGHASRKGVGLMRITLHIGPFTVTIIVKRRNRHPARWRFL